MFFPKVKNILLARVGVDWLKKKKRVIQGLVSVRAKDLHFLPEGKDSSPSTQNGWNRKWRKPVSSSCRLPHRTSSCVRPNSKTQTKEFQPLDTRQLTNTCVCMFPACPEGGSLLELTYGRLTGMFGILQHAVHPQSELPSNNI